MLPINLPDIDSLSLIEQVSQMVVVRTCGMLYDHQIQYPQWELNNSKLQALISERHTQPHVAPAPARQTAPRQVKTRRLGLRVCQRERFPPSAIGVFAAGGIVGHTACD